MSTNLWAALGTAIGTLVLLVIPVIAYAYYVLEIWIDDQRSYARVNATIEKPTSSVR
jgi:hypothetical protein